MVVVMGTAQLTDHFGISGVQLKQSLGYLTPGRHILLIFSLSTLTSLTFFSHVSHSSLIFIPGFHHDGLHEDGPHIPGGLAPPIVTSMFCHAAPDDTTPAPGEESRGATLFTSTERALEEMPAYLRQQLDGVVVFYDNQHMGGPSDGPNRDYERLGSMEMQDGFRKTFTNQSKLKESLSAVRHFSIVPGLLNKKMQNSPLISAKNP